MKPKKKEASSKKKKKQIGCSYSFIWSPGVYLYADFGTSDKCLPKCILQQP